MLTFFRALWGAFPTSGSLTFSMHSPGHRYVTCRHVPFAAVAGLSDTDVAELGAVNAGKTRSFSLPQDVYFGLASRRADLESSQQGRKEDCVALPAFCIDLDVMDPAAHKAKSLPRTTEEALVLLEDEPPPTLVVQSGHGVQCYWCFEEPVDIASQGLSAARGIDVVESRYEAFWKRFQSRAAAREWHLDKVHTVERIWRVPGLVNYKVPTVPREVKLLRTSGFRYRMQDLG